MMRTTDTRKPSRWSPWFAGVLLAILLLLAAWVSFRGLDTRWGAIPQVGRDDPKAALPATGDVRFRQTLSTLRDEGVEVGPVEGKWSCDEGFLTVTGRRFTMGNESVCLYPYPSANAARADVRQVPPKADDGLHDWAEDLRYFHCGEVIAVHLGRDPSNVVVLSRLCGTPFAHAKRWAAPAQ